MGHVIRLLLINPPPSSSSSPLLHLRRRTSLDSSSVFSLRTSITKSKPRFSCLFSGGNNQREEQARKALESALGGKKNEFDKWDKEIKKREESGGGGGDGGGGGGWFGGGGGGWFSGDHFWNEAQQITITLLAILLVYMIVAKGEVMAAFVLNPLLYALRGTREGLTSLSSKLTGGKVSKVNGDDSEEMWKKDGFSEVSAKESVVRKWGSD
ncbi:hypothetical protein HID58_050969 [Brassica napus]|uniref:(rape) hypothetical protein n=1 Tax=Brassica napus TaxID=3708 RepID=A0A816I3U8_BRANA|nr:uncharacterized protein LOC106386712 [Brassica napus]KAH0888540.1 hypothetical protein HID58_050969 [Brassica napus]CAF1698030.1 unnamed protein product [Brassica napus]